MKKNLPETTYLGRKIMALNTALFRPDIEGGQLPNNIITTLEVDAQDRVWFFTSGPKTFVPEYDLSYFGSLAYYSKVRNARICLSGTFTIVPFDKRPDLDPSSLNMSIIEGQILLISLKIEHADGFNLVADREDSWMEKMKMNWQHWISSARNEKKKFRFHVER